MVAQIIHDAPADRRADCGIAKNIGIMELTKSAHFFVALRASNCIRFRKFYNRSMLKSFFYET